MDIAADRARFNMIQQQIRPWGVLDDRVLEVMSSLPREEFVPPAYRGLAYADIEIPVGPDACLLAPKVVGRLLQALAIKAGERILQVGLGTGYIAACLARLGGQVIGLEIDETLADEARTRLTGMPNIEIRVGDVFADSPAGGSFDCILVTGSLPTEEALAPLEALLAEGGRLCCILGEAPAMQAALFTRVGPGDLERQNLFETLVPALRNAPVAEAFAF